MCRLHSKKSVCGKNVIRELQVFNISSWGRDAGPPVLRVPRAVEVRQSLGGGKPVAAR